MDFLIKCRPDYCPQFDSREFKNCSIRKNIYLHLTITNCLHQANGEVERQNHSILKRLSIAYTTRESLEKALCTYTFLHYTTPHSTTGVNTCIYNVWLRIKRQNAKNFIELYGFTSCMVVIEYGCDQDMMRASNICMTTILLIVTGEITKIQEKSRFFSLQLLSFQKLTLDTKHY